jgi:hypothetical protein
LDVSHVETKARRLAKDERAMNIQIKCRPAAGFAQTADGAGDTRERGITTGFRAHSVRAAQARCQDRETSIRRDDTPGARPPFT